VARTAGVGLALAAAGWLLFERATGPAERGVFVLGAVLLLGGAATYLGNSPLFTGLVAGAVWRHAPGRADQVIRQDLRRLQHPLVVLLLVVAGASVVVDRLAVWLLVPFVAFRLAGKLAAGWAASRATPALAPADLGAWLVPPGLVGLAFALSVAGATDLPAAGALVSAVALGTVASEVVAMLVVPAGERS
jgi:Kef-type K+ transport system membrane component KefB